MLGRVCNSVPSLYPLDAKSKHKAFLPPGCDNQKCLQTLPNVSCEGGAKPPPAE